MHIMGLKLIATVYILGQAYRDRVNWDCICVIIQHHRLSGS